MMKLGPLLHKRDIKRMALAAGMDLSPATVTLLINYHKWPKKWPKEEIKARIFTFLDDPELGEEIFEEYDPAEDEPEPEEVESPAPAATECEAKPEQSNDNDDLEIEMLLRKQVLTPNARRAFGLVRDPFDEVRNASEVFVNAEFRYVRESLRQIAKHGGFMAVVGESGAGKSTLRRDLIQWANDDEPSINIIEPYVLGLEDNDMKGKTLKAGHIAEAIMAKIAPGETLRRSPEARFRQVHNALRESHRAGYRHVLVIEEAHGLPIPTLKHLKRFFELEDGFSKLISIILIGQTELAQKLDERNPQVREVVQRCEVVNLRPIDMEVEGYLDHRFQLAGRALADVMDAEAVEALRKKLSGRGEYSVLYPLAINNVVAAALNEAAKLGVPMLTADLIREV
ncbi:AAA family ATPase [Alcanivorax sp.]|uniref:ExeA family protein n=1 Tax=Alcanivorax sp. TaxID=1872427 RepID=UPI000C0D623D|nr:AAA family ATPase [Alcanivorax sp.]PHR68475.1 MAG: transposase [Alcanivorax sp.]